MVIMPYRKWVSEAVEHTLRRHGISTAVRPHKTLHQLLVHPKDKRSVQESGGVIYYIPKKNCTMVYIGETSRRFKKREKEYKKDVKHLEGVKNTRVRRKESLTAIHQSALTDHIASKNHTIDWEGVRPPSKRTRLDEERGERSHLHQEGGHACDQP